MSLDCDEPSERRIGKNWQKTVENQRHQCDVCRCVGGTHFRVTSDKYNDWLFVCPNCWTTLSQDVGYRYGGTRKSNRRQGKQPNNR